MKYVSRSRIKRIRRAPSRYVISITMSKIDLPVIIPNVISNNIVSLIPLIKFRHLEFLILITHTILNPIKALLGNASCVFVRSYISVRNVFVCVHTSNVYWLRVLAERDFQRKLKNSPQSLPIQYSVPVSLRSREPRFTLVNENVPSVFLECATNDQIDQ